MSWEGLVTHGRSHSSCQLLVIWNHPYIFKEGPRLMIPIPYIVPPSNNILVSQAELHAEYVEFFFSSLLSFLLTVQGHKCDAVCFVDVPLDQWFVV